MIMTIPSLALVLGDPAVVGPVLVAKVLSKQSNRQLANIAIIADKDELEKGMTEQEKGAGQKLAQH